MPQLSRSLLAVVVLGAVLPGALHAQLSLREALREADRGAYANRAAAGTAAAEHARTLAPLRGILPTARVEAGFVRTTDPIGAFGTTLRQRTVTQAAFDPARLNFPAPVNNYQTGVVAEVPLFNPDAWVGRQAAHRASDASDAQATWTRLATRADVIRAYYGAVLATERVTTLEASQRAARAHLAQAQAMVRQGVVTKADALLASVRAGEVDTQLAQARGDATSARQQLAMLLGRSAGELPTVPGALPGSEAIRAVAAADTALAPMGTRADVYAAEAGHDAARADVRRARATMLPRLNSFARYDWNAPTGAFAGEKNWTVGVMATWNLFTGASELADLQGAAGRELAARAQAEAAVAQARLEADQTHTALDVALQRLALAEQGAAQSAEAHRLVARRYGGGLATVAELLDAQATETGSALALANARYGVITAAAARRQALGADPGELAALDQAAAPVAAPATPDPSDPTAPAPR